LLLNNIPFFKLDRFTFQTKNTQQMKKLILSAIATAITFSAVNAQSIAIGPEAGLNLTTVNVKSSGASLNTGFGIGGRVGAVAEIAFTKNLYFRPGLQFSMLGGKDGDYPSGTTITINYLQLPLNVVYKLGKEGEGRFYFGVTPYLGYALGGKYKNSTISESLKIGSDDATDNVKALDFGAGVKVGYELPMGFYADAAFLQGLSNNQPGGNSDNKMTNRIITVGVGYFLFRTGGKK
jgi:hypothetical protein